MRCYNSNRLGQIAKHCSASPRSRDKQQLERFRQKGPGLKETNKRLRAKFATTVQSILPEFKHSKYLKKKKTRGEVIVDSGAYEYAVSDLKYLQYIVRVSPMHVKLVNGLKMTDPHTGQVLIDTRSITILFTKLYLISTL